MAVTRTHLDQESVGILLQVACLNVNNQWQGVTVTNILTTFKWLSDEEIIKDTPVIIIEVSAANPVIAEIDDDVSVQNKSHFLGESPNLDHQMILY